MPTQPRDVRAILLRIKDLTDYAGTKDEIRKLANEALDAATAATADVDTTTKPALDRIRELHSSMVRAERDWQAMQADKSGRFTAREIARAVERSDAADLAYWTEVEAICKRGDQVTTGDVDDTWVRVTKDSSSLPNCGGFYVPVTIIQFEDNLIEDGVYGSDGFWVSGSPVSIGDVVCWKPRPSDPPHNLLKWKEMKQAVDPPVTPAVKEPRHAPPYRSTGRY